MRLWLICILCFFYRAYVHLKTIPVGVYPHCWYSISLFYLSQAREKNISLSTEINFGQHHHLICKGTGSPQDEGEDLTTRLVDDMKVLVDRHKMSQVIHNLVSNAIKFTPTGGHVSVSVSLDDGSEWITNVRESNSNGMYDCALVAGPFVKITVADTGVGLSQVRKSRLSKYDLTTQIKSTTATI